MKEPRPLEDLYAEALQAIRAKDHGRAAELLRQILIADENFKDASQLLARVVRARRRRWYNNLRLWAPLGIAALVGLAVWLAPRLPKPTAPAPSAQAEPTAAIPTAVPTLAQSPTPPDTPVPEPTPVPLAWKRLYAGQEFSRDTITAIVIDPSDPDVAYVGTETAGVYKTIDGGLSWSPIHNGLRRAHIDSLFMDPGDPQVIYAGVRNGGVYRTTDGGARWEVFTRGLATIDSDNPSRVLGSPSESSRLYFSNGFGFFRTRFEGWITASPSHHVWDFALNPGGGQSVLFLGQELGSDSNPVRVFWSQEGGLTAEALDFPDEPPWDGSVLLRSGPAGEQYLHVLARNGLYSSSDGGRNWTAIYGCRSAAADPQGGLMAACGSSLTRTADGGRSWQPMGPLPVEADRVVAVAVSAADSRLIFLGVDDGVFRSADGGGTWEKRNSGLGSDWLDLETHPFVPSGLYLQDGDCVSRREATPLYRSLDGGSSWGVLDVGGCGLAIDADGSTVYRGSGFRSADAGDTWLGRSPPGACSSAAISAHPNEPGLLYSAGSQSLCVTRDGGRTWEELGALAADWLPADARIYFTDTPGRIYAVPFHQMWVSNNGGSYWRMCDEWTSWNPLTDARLAVDPTDDTRLLRATLGGGVWISTDGCNTWQKNATGIRGQFVNAIVFDPRQPSVAYAGTDNGVFVSFDGGENWAPINDGLLGALVVYSVAIDAQSQVYAATPYGIFRLEAR